MTVTNAGTFTTADGAALVVGTEFIQNGAGVNVIGGNISTTNANISFATGVTLTNDINMSTGNGAGNILFSSTVTGTTAGAEDLTLTAGTGNITFGDTVGATRLGVIDINSAANVTAVAITAAALNQDVGTGTTTLNGAVNTNTAAGVTLTGTNLAVNAAITTTNGGVVTFIESGMVVIAAAGDITADGAVSITATGKGGISTAGDVTTTNDNVTYVSATTLTGPIAVSSGTGNITFENTLDGGFALTLASSGVEQFNGAVGKATALASIQTDAPGSVVFNGGSVTTTGAQTYLDAATVGVDTTLSAITTGNITLASTVNGAKSLTINDAGQTLLGGEIGGVTPLVDLTVDTGLGLVLPKTTLSANMSLTTGGAVTQVGALYVGGTTHIDADANPITLTNSANDFVGLVGAIEGKLAVGVKGTVVSITDKNDINLGQIEATAGAVTINAGGSIYNGLTGVTNITSTAASMLGGNGGVVGTLARPVTVNLPSVEANATRQQGGVSIDLSGRVGDNTIWLTQTPPGLVILNGMILNAGQIPGVPQNAYATALAVLDQTYLTGNGAVLNTKPYSSVGTLNSAMYPTDDNDKAFNYGPYIYKLPRSIEVKGGGVKLPAGVQIISMNK
jgi:hypothetical protein